LAGRRVGSPKCRSGVSELTPDATQPRVTVRPKPPVLLGATSATARWRRAEIVSDNLNSGLARRLQGSHRTVTRTVFIRFCLPAPTASPLRDSKPTLDPALRRFLGHLPCCLAAFLPASLAPTLRCSLGVRRVSVSELVLDCSSRCRRSMGFREIPTFSPPFSVSSPGQVPSIPNSSPCGVRTDREFCSPERVTARGGSACRARRGRAPRTRPMSV
jgi:hypothetical protein